MTSRSLNPHEPAYTKAARKADRKAAKAQNRIARRALRRASLASLSLERHLWGRGGTAAAYADDTGPLFGCSFCVADEF